MTELPVFGAALLSNGGIAKEILALEERTPSDRFFIHWPEDREVRTTGSFWDAIYQDNNLLTEVLWGAQAWRESPP